MKRYRWTLHEPLPIHQPLSACIGYFDGIHIGHQALIQEAIAHANSEHLCSALITFDPDPWVVLRGMTHVPHITTLEQRQSIAEALGIEVWITIAFTRELADLPWQEFIAEVLLPCQVRHLTCGFDFSFGRRGEGKPTDLLSDARFVTHVIASVNQCDEKISSTRIVAAIEAGRMEEATQLLGRPYTVSTTVIHGNHIGHSLGFPTANLDLYDTYIMPAVGVYSGYVTLEHAIHPAMINVGYNPTCNRRERISVEVHILDFDADLYGQCLTVSFKRKLRDEIRFASKEELIEQLRQDVQTVARDFERSHD